MADKEALRQDYELTVFDLVPYAFVGEWHEWKNGLDSRRVAG
jgi:hypothetical protein